VFEAHSRYIVNVSRTGRRAYRLTDEGHAHVAADPEAFTEPWAAVAESVSEDMVDMRSLFGQVGMALREVAQAGAQLKARFNPG
jgi:hypothetical protein